MMLPVYTVQRRKKKPLLWFNRLQTKIRNKKLKWEVDFPEQQDNFNPFLNTEVRIEPNGKLTSRLSTASRNKRILPCTTTLAILSLLRLIQRRTYIARLAASRLAQRKRSTLSDSLMIYRVYRIKCDFFPL